MKNEGTHIMLCVMIDEWHTRLKQRIQNALDNGDTAIGIARKAGLNRTQVDDMLRKDTRPRVDTFLKLCSALEVEPTEILTGVKGDPETIKAVQMFAAMPEGQRKAFLAMLETVQPGNVEAQKEPEPNLTD